MYLKNGKMETFLKKKLMKKIKINTASIISFLLLGGVAFANEDIILGDKFLYRNKNFYNPELYN